MARKIEITGKAVIYTKDGVQVIDAEVRRKFNANYDGCAFKFNFDGDYLLIGGARTIPTENIYAQNAYNPQKVQQAVNYGETKFFRFMLDLMRLAQWEPIHKFNRPLNGQYFMENQTLYKNTIDYNKRGYELDLQLYRKYGFSPAMIKFVEDNYK